MSPRTTGLLLIVALLLGAGLWVWEIREGDVPEGSGTGGDELFPGLEAADVSWVELTTLDDRAVRAERGPAGWRLVEPGDFEADEVAISGLVSQLASLEVEGRVSGDAPPADFGLADEADRVRFEAGGAVYALWIGRRTPVGSNTYVRSDPGEGIAYVSTWRTNALRKRLADLRDRRVIDFDHAAVDRVEVEWPGGGVVIVRRDDAWRLQRPVEERADRATVETLLSDLAFLRAEAFIDEPVAPAEVGLDAPVGLVRIGGQGEANEEGVAGEPWTQELAFGGLRDGRRVVRGANGSLFLVEAERLEDIPREVLAYRFKSLGEFDVAAARGLALTLATGSAPGDEPRRIESILAGGRWQSVPEPVDDETIRSIVTTLSRLQATTIVAESVGDAERAALGLAPPRVHARVTGEDGEVLADVSFGVVQPGRGWLALRADSPIVYSVDATVADRLPLDAADFDARFAGEGDPPESAEEPAADGTDDDRPHEAAGAPTP